MLTIAKNINAVSNSVDNRQILASENEKWQAVLARNSNADGVFVFAVRSTGIYCKPSCAAKRPSREQVVFFPGPSQAEQSGFRPCRRCTPRNAGASPRAVLVDSVSKYVEANLGKKLTLSNLGANVGVSPYYLQRTFKHILGISPREYVKTLRLAKMKLSLRQGETVTSALYNAGFTSRSRLYEKVPGPLGVNPGMFRRGGAGLSIEYGIMDSPLGPLLVGSTERGVCAVCMGDSDEAVETALVQDYPEADLQRDDDGTKGWVGAFMKYFGGYDSALNLPVDVQATAFQWRIWKEIQAIPRGSTTTYRRIARALRAPKAARAVARACATNPVSLIIPCHRVIGEDGKLHGYRWGVKRKKALLLLEQAADRETVGPA